MMKNSTIFTIAILFLTPQFLMAAQTALTTGVNITNLNKVPEDDQKTMLKEIRKTGATHIRTSIDNNQSGTKLAKLINETGLKIHWIARIDDSFPKNTKRAAFDANVFPRIWATPPLSKANPELFRESFSKQLKQFQSNHIEISAIELYNEINTAAFNGDFPIPGEGRQLGLDDLEHDPIGKNIALGFRQYYELLKATREEMDKTISYRNTPLISGGLGSIEAPEGKIQGMKSDIVSLNATIDYFSKIGITQIVDGIGVHVYPWQSNSINQKTRDLQDKRLNKYILSRCEKPNSSNGKPCWITEWGFRVKSTKCPIDDGDRLARVEEFLEQLSPFIADGRVMAIYYYTWNADPTDQADNSENQLAAFLCNAATESGRAAIAPYYSRKITNPQ